MPRLHMLLAMFLIGAAVFAFSGCPAAGFDHAVFCRAGQSEVVDVGLAAVGPIRYSMVDLAVGPGHGAARAGTAAVPGKTVSMVHRSAPGIGPADDCRPVPFVAYARSFGTSIITGIRRCVLCW